MDFMKSGVVESIRKNRVALKGPMATAVAGGAPSINVGLRQALELYANLRPVKNLEGVQSRFQNVDIVMVRENTEDLYAGLEHTVVPGVVESLKIITEKASTRIARYAFEYARKYGRKKIHAIHKANIMKLSDGLFLESVRKVAPAYPEIEYKEIIVDNACMQMVLESAPVRHAAADESLRRHHERPRRRTCGRTGRGAQRNIGESVAVFEAVHGTAPDIAGKGIANPTALLMSAILMLDHIGEASGRTKNREGAAQCLSRGRVADARRGRHCLHC